MNCFACESCACGGYINGIRAAVQKRLAGGGNLYSWLTPPCSPLNISPYLHSSLAAPQFVFEISPGCAASEPQYPIQPLIFKNVSSFSSFPPSASDESVSASSFTVRFQYCRGISISNSSFRNLEITGFLNSSCQVLSISYFFFKDRISRTLAQEGDGVLPFRQRAH